MISVLVPTWGRPERLQAMVESVLATAANPEAVEVLIRVAHEDPCCGGYPVGDLRRTRIYYPRHAESYGKGIEFLQRRAHGDILCAASDDVLFRTPGWDLKVHAAFDEVPDGLLVAYANNGLDREKCEHFFTSRRWIKTVGYMVRTEFRHFCVDQWVEELANGIGRLTFLRDVVIEHMHKKYKKAADDATYQLVRGDTRTSEKDNELYAQLAPARAASLAALKAAMA